MDATKPILVCAFFVVFLAAALFGAEPAGRIEVIRYESEYSSVAVEPTRVDGRPGLAVVFQGTDDLHYYARSETAPAPDLQLKVAATSEIMEFGQAVLPAWKMFTDSLFQQIEVYVGNFTVFIPINTEIIQQPLSETDDIEITISGIACTSQLCLPPFEKRLAVTVDLGDIAAQPNVSVLAVRVVEPMSAAPAVVPADDEDEPEREAETSQQTILSYGIGVYYLLAILAGMSINIMPCVLPVIPLVLARLIDQSKKSNRNRMATGMAFCAGVILFFAAFALVSAIINITTGTVLDLNSLFRYPTAVIVLFLAIVFFALAMLDIVTVSLPSVVTNRQSSATDLAGTAGMGFFAAILSTPCSGALLGFVLVWAQTQPLHVSSSAIVLMGIGMALPYAVFVSVPSLMERIPKPGAWMEIFKKSTGFLLLLIAAKLTLAALPKERLLNVLTYGIIFSFCVWMWAKWVGFGAPAGKKWTIRLIAVALALGAGWWLLPALSETSIDWQPYDRTVIRSATSQGRPVLLKFTADWCTNCKVVEKRVYQNPEIVQLIEARNILPIKADTTLHHYAATIDLVEVYGEAGNVPVTIVIRPNGEIEDPLRGIFGKDRLVEIIKAIPEQAADGHEETDTIQSSAQENAEEQDEWFR